MEDKTIVEAVLFAATESLRVEQIVERTGLQEADVRYALRDLRRDYDNRDSAIVISSAGGNYRMVLRQECQKYIDDFARPAIPGGVMRTLVTIAYNQPALQSELVRVRGPRAYEDVKVLREMGLVSASSTGNTKELTTTPKFAEMFGIGTNSKAAIRKWIEANSTNLGKGGNAAEGLAPEDPNDAAGEAPEAPSEAPEEAPSQEPKDGSE